MGSYESATRYPFQDPANPGLDFSGSGRGCNQLSGSFAISQIRYDWFGNVVRLGATLTQHCENQTPALFGNVNYQFGTVGPMPLGHQNVLVSWRNRVQELTRAGTLVKTVPILGGTEKPNDSEVARDLIRDSAGRLHVYTGTYSPVLDSLVPASGAWIAMHEHLSPDPTAEPLPASGRRAPDDITRRPAPGVCTPFADAAGGSDVTRRSRRCDDHRSRDAWQIRFETRRPPLRRRHSSAWAAHPSHAHAARFASAAPTSA